MIEAGSSFSLSFLPCGHIFSFLLTDWLTVLLNWRTNIASEFRWERVASIACLSRYLLVNSTLYKVHFSKKILYDDKRWDRRMTGLISFGLASYLADTRNFLKKVTCVSALHRRLIAWNFSHFQISRDWKEFRWFGNSGFSHLVRTYVVSLVATTRRYFMHALIKNYQESKIRYKVICENSIKCPRPRYQSQIRMGAHECASTHNSLPIRAT